MFPFSVLIRHRETAVRPNRRGKERAVMVEEEEVVALRSQRNGERVWWLEREERENFGSIENE